MENFFISIGIFLLCFGFSINVVGGITANIFPGGFNLKGRKYRILEKEGVFFPQIRHCLIGWKYVQETQIHIAGEDDWGTSYYHWNFKTRGEAENFLKEYPKGKPLTQFWYK